MRNILILSAGRRVELVQHFRNAIAKKSPSSRLVAADAQKLAPALFFADDAVLLPRVTEENYEDELCRVIEDYEIDLVIPTIDPELPVLANLKSEIESQTSAYVMIADTWVVEVCNDKVLTYEHLSQSGIQTPAVYQSPADLDLSDFPVIVKPRAGSSSIGVSVVHSPEQLDAVLPNTVDPMVQELVAGDEFTVDCFSDVSGTVVSVVPRLRIATRGGEVLKGRIVRNEAIIQAVKRLLVKLPIPGHSTVQCFETERGVEIIEINPRFGGGAPMSISAGANSCERLIDMMNGIELEYENSFEDGLTFLRFDQSIALRDADVDFGS